MKNLKKILALVLAFACAFTMFAVAGAADFTDKDKIKNYEAVNTLVALNILKGRDDGSFDPDATVTRAEMAKMIFVIWNGGKDDATAYETMDTIFSDVSSHWAKGYINFCAANNIIAGMGDGTFAPDQTVTGQQAAKMLLVLMGYDDQHAGLTGHKWAQNTMSYAGLAGLFKDVDAPVEQGMPRQYAAQMVYNTLEANRVKWSTDNNSFDEITQWSGQNFVKETVGRKYMNYATVEGILVEARNGDEKGFTLLLPDSSSKYSIAHTTDTEKKAFNDKLWADTKYTTDLSEYLGQEVKVSYNTEEHDKNRDNSIYGVYSTENNVVVTTTANKVADAKESGKIKLNDVKYKINDNLLYYYSTTVNGSATDLTSSNFVDNKGSNLSRVFGDTIFNDKGEEVTSNGTKALYADYEPLSANTVKFVDFDNDGKFDLAIDYPMAVAEVSMVSSSTISVKDVRGVALTTNAPKREDVVEYDGIAKGDIVQITWDSFKDKATFKKLETTDETVGSVRNDINASNEEYNISTGWVKRYSNVKDSKTGLMGANSITTKLKSGDKATFALINGIAYYVDRTQSGTGNDVAVVVSTGYSGTNGANGETVEAKLMFADGTTSVVTVDSIIPNWSKDSNNAWVENTDSYDLDSTDIRNVLGMTSGAKDIEVLNKYLAGFTYINGSGDNKKPNTYKYPTSPITVDGSSVSNPNYWQLLRSNTIAPALVTYSRSGGDYTLQLLDEATNDAGYDSVNNAGTWNKGSGDATVGGKNLLDDGTVFVVYNNSSVKRYTGAQAKKLQNSQVKSNTYSLVEKSNGVERARIAAVYANSEPNVSGAGNYAYVLDDTSSKTIDGTSYIILTAYTENGAETLYAEKGASNRTSYNKGDVVDFSYTTSNITDNGAEYRVIDDVNRINAQYAAITGWDRNDISVLVDYVLDDQGNSTSSSDRGKSVTLDVDTDDTTVLVVDTDGKTGVSATKDGIQTADELPDYVNTAGTHFDAYQVNAKVYYFGKDSNGYDTGDAFELIVVDSLNNWLDDDMKIAVDNGVVNYNTGNNNNNNNNNNTSDEGQGDIQKALNDNNNTSADGLLSAVKAELTDDLGNNQVLRVPANKRLNIVIDKPTIKNSTPEAADKLCVYWTDATTQVIYLNGKTLDNTTTETIDLSKIVGQAGATLRFSVANGFGNGQVTGSFTTTAPDGTETITPMNGSVETAQIALRGNEVFALGSMTTATTNNVTYTWNTTSNTWVKQ